MCIDGGQVVADHAVVFGGVGESLFRQVEAHFLADGALACRHFLYHCGVIDRIGHHRHMGVILGRGAHHGGAADVDVLDGVFKRAVRFRHRCGERVEVHDHQIDRRDIGAFHGSHMRAQVAPPENAAMNLGVQGFDPAIQHFRETGVVTHFDDRDAGLLQHAGGTAGGKNFHAELAQGLREFHYAGFVGDADKRAFDDCHIMVT